jgi:hypothetical protein
MPSTPSVDNVIKYYLKQGWPIPLDALVELEGKGIIINEYLDKLESEVNGESEFYDSHWGS